MTALNKASVISADLLFKEKFIPLSSLELGAGFINPAYAYCAIRSKTAPGATVDVDT
jgi:hypothetical protein